MKESSPGTEGHGTKAGLRKRPLVEEALLWLSQREEWGLSHTVLLL